MSLGRIPVTRWAPLTCILGGVISGINLYGTYGRRQDGKESSLLSLGCELQCGCIGAAIILWLNSAHLITVALESLGKHLEPNRAGFNLPVYSSGQRGETVNLLASAYEGSNPSAGTDGRKKGLYAGVA